VRQFQVASCHSLVIASYPPCPFPCCAPRHRYRHSTCNLPHEQLLIGLEAGGALSSVICHSFIIVCRMSFVHCHLSSFSHHCLSSFGRHCLSSFFHHRLSLFVHRCLSLFVCQYLSLFVCHLSSIVHCLFIVVHCHQLASIVPTYPPCEQWLTAAGGRG
jgi:hypothetical protein